MQAWQKMPEQELYFPTAFTWKCLADLNYYKSKVDLAAMNPKFTGPIIAFLTKYCDQLFPCE